MHDASVDVDALQREIERLRDAVAHLERLNAAGRAVTAELDHQRVAQTLIDAATELTGAEIGALFYSVSDWRIESYMLYAVAGVPREQLAKLPLPRNTAILAP